MRSKIGCSRPYGRRVSAPATPNTHRTGALIVAAAFLLCFLAVSVPATPAHALPAVFTVNTVLDDPDDGICNGTHCSLREAINNSNDNNNTSELDTIIFDLPGAAPWTILPVGPLPSITERLTINGFCPTCDSSPNTAATSQAIDAVYTIVLNGGLAGAGVSGLSISTTETVTIRGLVINNWGSNGIRVNADGDHVIAGNFIGTSITGTSGVANNNGITVFESDGLTIGGPNPADRNVISGNTGNGILGCDPDVDNLTIRGNFIGPAASGTAALINGISGISLCQGSGITIGGNLASGHSNVISGNLSYGIDANDVFDLDVQGNRIGTIRGGTAPLPNGASGIRVTDSNTVDIGGGASGNTISGNFDDGVRSINTDNLTIRNNTIGIAASGGTAIPNGDSGIVVDGGSNIEIASNYVGENLANGIVLDGQLTTVGVKDNFIGLTFNGTNIGNINDGIRVTGAGSTNVTIGGANDGNFIVNNGGFGINVNSGDHMNFIISGNQIGTDNGSDKGNFYAGVYISSGASGTFIVGESTAANDIRYNGDDGITVTSSTANVAIRYNRISDNGDAVIDLPIDLGGDGETANDSGDTDTGANSLQNYPLFEPHYSNYLRLSLETTPFGSFTIDLYEALCIGGQAHPITRVGTSFQAGTPTGVVVAEFMLSVDIVTPGAFVTATATNAAGQTSEVNPACTEAIPAVLIADLGGLDFYPANRTIPRGTELAFVNRHVQSHTATSDVGIFPAFTTGVLNSRDEATILFDTVGVYPYHCEIHPGMTGTITVTGTNPDPDITAVSETAYALNNSELVISGTGFISGSMVEWNGTELDWTFSGSDIVAEVPAGLLAATGAATLRVTNPAPVDPDGFDEFAVTIHRAPGDVDCDLDVDALDALAVLRSLAGFTTGLLPQVCLVDPVNPPGDANRDGDETVGDVLFIRSWAAGIQ